MARGNTIYFSLLWLCATKKDDFVRERWGEHCFGYWTKWSNCTSQCYQQRSFTFLEDHECPDSTMRRPEEVEYTLCTGDFCHLRPDSNLAFFDLAIDVLLKDGLPSNKVQELGSLVESSQITIHLLLFLCISVAGLVRSFQIAWLPDICVVIPASALVALRFRNLTGTGFGPAGNAFFGPVISRIMSDLLIPISIFEGAYTIQIKNFYAVFKTGLLFAVVGTGLSTVLIATMVKHTGEMGWHPVSHWRESFAFAAFIADVDPVATLSIFSSLKVDALLSTLVAGEATLNDPIALVIFGVCNQRGKRMEFDLMEQTLYCLGLLSSSIAVGLLVGFLFVFLFKVMRLPGQGSCEPSYVFVCAYLGYCIGQLTTGSGIIVTLFSGLVMGIYMERFVEDKVVVDSFLASAARLADAAMFAIIGFCCFLLDDWAGLRLGLLTILFCFVARAIMFLLMIPLVNCLWSLYGLGRIDIRRSIMMWHSGLRGGMTVMMALMVDPYWSKNQNVLLNATLVVVIGHAYLCGCTGPLLLKILDIPVGVTQTDGCIRGASSPTRLRRADHVLRNILSIHSHYAGDVSSEASTFHNMMQGSLGPSTWQRQTTTSNVSSVELGSSFQPPPESPSSAIKSGAANGIS